MRHIQLILLAVALAMGDIVQLNSGGPWLTVIGLTPAKGTAPATCDLIWYEYGAGEYRRLPAVPQSCVRQIKPD